MAAAGAGSALIKMSCVYTAAAETTTWPNISVPCCITSLQMNSFINNSHLCLSAQGFFASH